MGPCIKNALQEPKTDSKFEMKFKKNGIVFDSISDGH
jgi:hypothetical protein